MPANDLPDVLETTDAERLATGFLFTEGPLWHPDGYWYFVDLRRPAHLDDAIALYQHDLVGQHPAGDAVEQPSGADRHCSGQRTALISSASRPKHGGAPAPRHGAPGPASWASAQVASATMRTPQSLFRIARGNLSRSPA